MYENLRHSFLVNSSQYVYNKPLELLFNRIDFGTFTEKNFTFNIVNPSCNISIVIPRKPVLRATATTFGVESLNFPFFQALVSDRLTHGLLSMFFVCATLIKE